MTDDLISRQAAIDALGERPMVWVGSDYELGARNQYDADVLALETVPSAQPEPIKLHFDHALTEEEIKNLKQMITELMPSAQPEIIRCKECKYYRWESDMCDYPYATAQNVVHEDDFCSKAERKTDE